MSDLYEIGVPVRGGHIFRRQYRAYTPVYIYVCRMHAVCIIRGGPK